MEDIDAFLKGEPADVAEAPVSTPEPPPEAAKEAEAPEAPEAATEDEAPVPDGPNVPVSALQAERKQRQDWKEKALRSEGELTEIRRQQAELQKKLDDAMRTPAPAAPQARAAEAPNPNEDPIGFITWQQEQLRIKAIDERLNLTEEMLRDKEGDEAVNAAIAAFKVMRETDPALQTKFIDSPNPYRWMFKEVQKRQAAAKIGNDPVAYESEMRAKLRAEWEAEQAAAVGAPAPTDATPRVSLPVSLATARSAGNRAAPGFAGPTPLEELFPTR